MNWHERYKALMMHCIIETRLVSYGMLYASLKHRLQSQIDISRYKIAVSRPSNVIGAMSVHDSLRIVLGGLISLVFAEQVGVTWRVRMGC